MAASDSVLSVEFKINLLAPARGELLVARGQVLKAGRTLFVCRADVFAFRGSEESLCATMQQTVMRMTGRPDAPAG
jgi:acyl-coenzyme A thioesterase PaaI-like protein